MDDMVFPTCWTGMSKKEFIDIADRGQSVGDVVIRSDIKAVIEFSKNLMRIIDKLEKALESYDRSEVARF
jgi:hypothetical protein